MKKSILSLAILTAFCSLKASAQMLSSLNFSTGYNNVSSTKIPFGNQDDNWLISGLTPPFTPPSGTVPYYAWVQAPWYWSSYPPSYNPITLPGSEWISYDVASMAVGSFDPVGGHVIFQYTFYTCSPDQITISANVLCDNGITSVLVDGVNTGFTMTSALSSNWTSAGTLSYMASLGSGWHFIQVEVENVASSQPNNAVGLDISGTISSPNNVIKDIDNFPYYECGSPKMNGTAGGTSAVNSESHLEQNTPNPFMGSTRIKYFIGNVQPNTFITITDLTGRTIMNYPINATGEGSISVGRELAPGTYLYNLYVNGHVIDSKRMVMSK